MRWNLIKTIKWVWAAAMLLLPAGCATAPQPRIGESAWPSASPAASAATTPETPAPQPSQASDAIKALMPGQAGYTWHYDGFAEYAMAMRLTAMDESGGILTYHCNGAVEDVSGGEATGDFSVRVDYQAKPGVLTQHLQGEKVLDNVFPDLELIREPLVKGASWLQTVRGANGQDTELFCSIDSVGQTEGRTVYSVTYQDKASGYYEKREITEGAGVTSFGRLYQFEDTSELLGYRLFHPDAQAHAAAWEQWLPELGREYTCFGLAEYGHKGVLTQLKASDKETVLEYRGIYSDGTGRDDRFVVRYHVDSARGTVTEEVVSNERGAKEVNSRLHNLVVLMFPLRKGSHWSHQATLNHKPVTVRAEITEYDESAGVVKVRYTAENAAGYYNDTYLEERTFEKGFGMTGFGCLMPGSIGLSGKDAKDPEKVQEALVQHMFGYSLNKMKQQ